MCPGLGLDCYGCFGPAENPECTTLQRRFAGLGLQPEQVGHRFRSFNAADPVLTGSVSSLVHDDD